MAEATTSGKLGVVLLNMGGPASIGEIRPFLTRLFSDAAMLPLSAPWRQLLARFIAWRRAPKVVGRYEAIGGGSPVGPESARQAEALQARLGPGFAVRHVFRYSPPGPEEALGALYDAGVTRLVVLSAYPQYSVTTSGSSFSHLMASARRLDMDCRSAPAYPAGAGFIRALARGIRPLLDGADHLLFTAHGLPLRVVERGDPYVDQVEETVAALGRELGGGPPSSLAFQSRLGPVEWVGPHIDEEIRRLGAAGVRRLVVAPVTFVCENLETLWDLDRQMADLARESGIPDYRRAPAPGSAAEFIEHLAEMARGQALEAGWIGGNGRGDESS